MILVTFKQSVTKTLIAQTYEPSIIQYLLFLHDINQKISFKNQTHSDKLMISASNSHIPPRTFKDNTKVENKKHWERI